MRMAVDGPSAQGDSDDADVLDMTALDALETDDEDDAQPETSSQPKRSRSVAHQGTGAASASMASGHPSALPILCRRGVCSVRELPPGSSPGGWSHRDKSEGINVSHDDLRASYCGEGKTDHDAAAIRTDHTIPTTGCAAYYFEVEVICAGQEGYIGIGLCAKDVNLSRLPGWEANSYGYHGDDGCAFLGHGTGVAYGPSYTTGDIVGCCWNMIENTVFFTRNGMALGTAFRNVKGTYSPTIGLRTVGEVVEANFGAKPFYFDVEAYIGEERHKLMNKITSLAIPREFDTVAETILEYMLHHGYAGSASIFARDTGRKTVVDEEIQKTLERHRICNYVLKGYVDRAVKALEAKYPSVLRDDRKIIFHLKCQKFIALIGQGHTDEAVAYGQKELAEFQGMGEDFNAELTEAFALLAYPEPAKSPMSYLLDKKKKASLAYAVNRAILGAQNRPKESILKRVVRHTTVTLEELSAATCGPSALISGHTFL